MDTCGDPASERLALCLHGFPENAYSWRHQLPLLAELGYRAWAPNQRGYGRTTPRPPDVASYAMDHLVGDVAALIDASGAKSVTLVGHDWGGGVAWFTALRRARPLDRLVVMNMPHPQRFHEALATSRAQQRRSRYERLFRMRGVAELLFRLGGARAIGQAFRGMAVDESRFPDEVLDVYKRQALEPGALTAMFNWYRANSFRKSMAERGPVIEVPTLLIWGTEDTALGVEMIHDMDELVRDVTVRTVHASHWVQQEAPEVVNEILGGWLRGEPAPSPDAPGDQSPVSSR